jgi:hypothetical protein
MAGFLRTVTAAAIAAALMVAAACGEDPFEAGNWSTASAAGVTLQWRVDGENLALRISAETTGWVAVGFDPGAGMEFANIIIGYVDGGGVHVTDDWGTDTDQHVRDTTLGGKNNVLDSDGSESGGRTEVEALIPLDSGDIFDKALNEGSTYTVILARGPDGADDYTTHHEAAGTTAIEI